MNLFIDKPILVTLEKQNGQQELNDFWI